MVDQRQEDEDQPPMIALGAAAKLATMILLVSRCIKVRPQLGSGADDAVQEFRDRLTKALPKPVELWGVKVGTHGNRLPADERAVLSSYLRARKWSVDDATSMFLSSLEWRREFGVDTLRSSSFHGLPQERFAGRDRQGRLLVVLRLSELSSDCFDSLDTFVRWRVYMQEQLNAKLDFDCGFPQYTLVLNCEGLSRGHFSKAARRAVGELSKVSCDNYPDYLSQILICNPPATFVVAFGILRPFLPRNFVKMIRVHSGDEQSCLEMCAGRTKASLRGVGWRNRQSRDSLTPLPS